MLHEDTPKTPPKHRNRPKSTPGHPKSTPRPPKPTPRKQYFIKNREHQKTENRQKPPF